MYYTQEFEFPVWLLILFVYCSSSMLFALVLRIHPANVVETTNESFNRITFAALHVFSLHLGQVSSRITKSRRRIALSVLILYSLILTLAYQSSLGSFLTVPWKREQIKSFGEILHGRYDCIGIPQGKRILQRFSSDNERLIELSKRYRVYENHFDTLVTKMQQRKNIVTFGTQRYGRKTVSVGVDKITEFNFVVCSADLCSSILITT